LEIAFAHGLSLQNDTVNCLVINDHEVECSGKRFLDEGGGKLSYKSSAFWINVSVCLGLVLIAGLMSGLTIGLMSLDLMTLEIMKNGGNEKSKKYAEKIIPIVKNHHLVLVTLLLCNAAANEALPIFLDKITSPVIAIIVSVSAILLFGEIIPQALCSRYALAISAHMAIFLKILIGLCFIVAWPISKLLDLILGTHGPNRFERKELKELIHFHSEAQKGYLSMDETTVIKGVSDSWFVGRAFVGTRLDGKNCSELHDSFGKLIYARI